MAYPDLLVGEVFCITEMHYLFSLVVYSVFIDTNFTPMILSFQRESRAIHRIAAFDSFFLTRCYIAAV